jgi:hypothetical protein
VASQGQLGQTLGPLTLSAFSGEARTGTLVATFGPLALSSSGAITDPTDGITAIQAVRPITGPFEVERDVVPPIVAVRPN